MEYTLIPGEAIHKRRVEWDAPSQAVAERWADEVRARGGEAEVVVRWNAYSQQWLVVVWVE